MSTLAGSGDKAISNGKGASASFSGPKGVALDRESNLFVTDEHGIRKVAHDGTVTTFAGSGSSGLKGGQGAGARFDDPDGIAVDEGGNLFVCDVGNHCTRKITPGGLVTTVVGAKEFRSGGIFHLPCGKALKHVLPSKFLPCPCGIAIGRQGNLLITEMGNHRIRCIEGAATCAPPSAAAAAAEAHNSAKSFEELREGLANLQKNCMGELKAKSFELQSELQAEMQSTQLQMQLKLIALQKQITCDLESGAQEAAATLVLALETKAGFASSPRPKSRMSTRTWWSPRNWIRQRQRAISGRVKRMKSVPANT